MTPDTRTGLSSGVRFPGWAPNQRPCSLMVRAIAESRSSRGRRLGRLSSEVQGSNPC